MVPRKKNHTHPQPNMDSAAFLPFLLVRLFLLRGFLLWVVLLCSLLLRGAAVLSSSFGWGCFLSLFCWVVPLGVLLFSLFFLEGAAFLPLLFGGAVSDAWCCLASFSGWCCVFPSAFEWLPPFPPLGGAAFSLSFLRVAAFLSSPSSVGWCCLVSSFVSGGVALFPSPLGDVVFLFSSFGG